jgi:hypothetical protein
MVRHGEPRERVEYHGSIHAVKPFLHTSSVTGVSVGSLVQSVSDTRPIIFFSYSSSDGLYPVTEEGYGPQSR